ncbi:hypothetical protein GCM10007874_65400 [Labrys miyagiensis]|uniref:Uncharacterized protein n=1 Tax=Labrys miyagiensis TaxID=346912 RepID=A0ABQ6CXW3_9HYPH|nr:hypothetical protein [Labrys miyagiensis]GLS23519.1 hypothetical protein GCM10007874_65400 [Labrys miyagiensis]
MRFFLQIAVCGLYVLSPVAASADCLADFNAIIHNNLNVGPYEADGLIQLADSASGAKADITMLTQVALPGSTALQRLVFQGEALRGAVEFHPAFDVV